MNKKIKSLIFGLVLLIGSNVYALNWNDFKTAVENSAPPTINLSGYLNAQNTLTWQDNLTVGGNKTFVGLRGNAQAILSGNNSKQGFSVANRTIQFYDNFEFKNFLAVNYEGEYYGVVGGAISGGNINFTSSTVNFSNNESASTGGAIGDSNITLESSTVNFTGNKARFMGGAIIESDIKFINTVANFTSNEAREDAGGAIGNSNITLESSIVDFSNNRTGYNGGAIWVFGNAYTTNIRTKFTGSTVNFSNNEASRHGGAIYVVFGGADNYGPVDISALINSTNSVINFLNNTAGKSGGAIYTEGNSSIIDFTSGTMNFIGNTAGYGGAIYNQAGTIIIEDPNFMGNSASVAGGAIVLTPGFIYQEAIMISAGGSTITIRAMNTDVVFSNNKVGNQANDIFVTGDSDINFYAQGNRKIDLQGGIIADDIVIMLHLGSHDFPLEHTVGNIKITKAGAGELILSGRNKLRGSLDIQEGKVTIKKGEDFDVLLTNLNVEEGATYSTVDGNASQETKVTSGTQAQATINGTLALDVDFDLISGDKLSATNITFGEDSRISVDAWGENYGSSVTIVSANRAIDTDENINALIDRSGSVYDDPLFSLQYGYDKDAEGKKIFVYAKAPRQVENIEDLSNGGFLDISNIPGSEINIGSPINISQQTVIDSGGKTFKSDGADTGLSVSGGAIVQINDLSFRDFDDKAIDFGGVHLTIAANTSDVVFKDNAIDLSVNAGGVRIIARDNRNVIFNDKVASAAGTDISKTGNGAMEFKGEVRLLGSLNVEQGYAKISSASVGNLKITDGTIELGYDGYIRAVAFSTNTASWLSISENIGVGETIGIIADVIVGTSTIIAKSADGRYETTTLVYYSLTPPVSVGFRDGTSGRSSSANNYFDGAGSWAKVLERNWFVDAGIAGSSISLSPVFIGNVIRQAAISDNSLIYSNVGERVWVAGQFGGGSLSDDSAGNFDSSVAGAKAGFAFVSGADFSAGVFAGFASRSYKQGDNKATASDMDFGLYSGLGLGGNVNLAGFVGYGLQSINAENAGDKADFDATIIKFGAKAEYAAGLISPFIGFEGAVVNTDDIDLKADGEGLKMDAATYTRLSSQIGAKIGRNVGGFSWFGRAYVDLLLAGNKPQYSVKPYYENDEVKTAAAKSKTIDATEESAASFGLGAGLSIPVSGVVDIFASAETKLNADYFGYQGNIGASFKF